jgi:2-amino-4-hydroxy-6-hydroxymethyldihydropteridine diphosphokinase
MADVFIGLGSNLGDRPGYLRQAMSHLNGSALRLRACSSFRETDPVGGPVQPEYVNAVARFESTLSPRMLMDRLLKIEARLGRTRSFENAPRTLDLDLLLYGQAQLQTAYLTLPHPRMTSRTFVLEPLTELVPLLNLFGQTPHEHLEKLRSCSDCATCLN